MNLISTDTPLGQPENISDLEKLLRRLEVDFRKWGEGPTKPSESLLREIASGESRLRIDKQGRLVRETAVVGIDVFFGDAARGSWRLVEQEQTFAGGQRRSRCLRNSLGEKQLPGESAELAARRAVTEELGLPASELSFLRTGSGLDSGDSSSYPGLWSIRQMSYFACSLPVRFYEPGGYEERQAEKTTRFAWRPIAMQPQAAPVGHCMRRGSAETMDQTAVAQH